MGDTLTQVEGVVKWFDPKKGFGFIVGPDEQDIFVHYSQIDGSGFRVLQDGERVVYDAVHTAGRGWNATAVRRVEPKPELEVHVKRVKPTDASQAAHEERSG